MFAPRSFDQIVRLLIDSSQPPTRFTQNNRHQQTNRTKAGTTMIATATLFGLDTDIAVSVTEPDALDRALRHTRTLTQRLDETINRACPSAEIVALDLADGQPVLVSSLLDQVIIEALFYDDLTDGATRAVRCASTDSPIPPWHRVRIGGAATAVPAGLRLELMATGRAFLADRATQMLAQELGCGVLVRVGDVAAAAGAAPPEFRKSDFVGTTPADFVGTTPADFVGTWHISIAGARAAVPANRAIARIGAAERALGNQETPQPRFHGVTVIADSAGMAQAAAVRVHRDSSGAQAWLHAHALTAHLDDTRDGHLDKRARIDHPVAAA
jgi:thiamine biosynthesis lipoprotein ApbE